MRFECLYLIACFAASAFQVLHASSGQGHICCYRVTLEAKPGSPPPVRQAAMLYDLWLLDVPKLLDLAALFGTGSPKLVHRLMQQVIAGRPVLCCLLTWQLCMHLSWGVI